MAEDWALDVKKYAPNADDTVIAAIVRYCGIALRSRDASLVSFTDSVETDRVRENYCKKKLGLTDADSVIDAAIAAVGTRMKGDSTRNRVTVYYLLAEHFGKLGLFGAASDMGDAPAAVAPVAVAAAAVPLMAVPPHKDENRKPAGAVAAGDSGWTEYLPMAVLLLGGAALFALIVGNKPEAAAPPVVAAVAAPAIPVGQGLIAGEVDGKPMLQVYFDTAKTDVSPEIVPPAGVLKAYLDSHPGSRLAVSGYNDPRGDAAMNAELSKNRAFAVRDSLVANGIAVTLIDLVKPADTTDTGTTMVQARRVDVTVVEGAAPAEAAAAPAEAAAEVAAPAR